MYRRQRPRAGPRPLRCGLAAGPRRTFGPPRPGLALGPLALRRRARGLGPVQAASNARACIPAPRRSAPRAGPGPSWPCGVAPAGARSPAPSLRRARLAGLRPCRPGLTPGLLALRGQARGLGLVRAASDAQACLPAPRGSEPLGTVRLRTATRTKACDLSATASALPLGRPPLRKDTSRLRGGHRSPHVPGPS